MFYPRIQILLDQGRHEDAEAAIREELKSTMEEPYLFFLLSVTLLNQSKPKEAEAAAREAIALDADFDLGFYMLSRCLLQQEKKRESLTAIEEAIRMDPADADYQAQKAQVYLEWSKYDKSLEAAEAGLSVYPDHEGCRFFRSITLEKLGRQDEAEAESLALLSESPDDYGNHCARGWILAQRGDTAAAERHFIEALRIYPDGEDARAGLAYTFRLQSPILGSVLRLLIWMERIPWWIFIVGIFVSMEIADRLAASGLPAPVPQLGAGIRVLFWVFFMCAMLIQPLFNLILSRSKTARHALSVDELRAVKWFVLPLVISLVYLVLWGFRGGGQFLPVHAVVWAALTRFIFEVFESTNLWVRKAMTAVTLLVFAGVIWIEYFTYGYLGPKAAELFRLYGESIQAARFEGEELGDLDRENSERFIEGFSRLYGLKTKFVNYVAIALWLLACFSDDIASFFHRRAPDA